MKEDRILLNSEIRAVTPPDDQQPKDDQDQQQETDNQEQSKPDNQIEGYALMFNQPSKDLGGFVEVIDPKALDGVDLSKVVMLDQHDYSKPLASVEAGTLKLDTDDKGLHFVATLDNSVSYAKDLLANIQNGNVDKMSFRFDIADGGDEFSQDNQGNVTRTIKQVKDLFELSTVTLPAYDSTNVDTRSYNQFIKEQERDRLNMKKTIEPKQTETRSFEEYIRSRGEVRDGLTTQGASAVIPKEVITPVFDLKKSDYNLAQYATVKTVSTGAGSYPISTNPQGAILATKEELADIADIDANMFKDVEYKIKTRAGKIALSNEIVEDSAVDIVAEVKDQLQKLVDNTDNKNIVDLLTGSDFQKVTAKSIDDLKKVFNVTLDPALNKMWLVNQTGFNYLDTLKDNEGRYLLQPDVTAPSGYAILGAPVVVVSNKVLADNTDGTSPMICGDIAQAVAVFRRSQTTAEWQRFDQFAEGLSVAVRNDYEVIDKDSAVNISLQTGAAKATSK